MARGSRKKRHICAECGESFKHGIGLRKHQRQTGHKGSRVEEEGATPPPEAAAPPPEPAAPAEPPPPAESPVVEESPVEESPVVEEPAAAAAPAPAPPPPAAADDDDQTVAVQRPPAHDVGPESPHYYQQAPPPTQMQHTKQKLDLVSRGLRILFSARAKEAGQSLKRGARSSADILAEAIKLAIALVFFLAIPTIIFFWWRAQNPQVAGDPNRPENFTFDNGALAARSTLLRYLDHLGNRRYEDAYGLLSPAWQGDINPGSFRDAFIDIDDVRWAVSDQRLHPNGAADVLVRLAFKEGGKPRIFIGRFRLRKGPQGWRIDRAELSPDRSG